MSLNLPETIADYVEANARLDLDGMLKHFARDSVFIDNGKRYEGLAEIRKLLEGERWSRKTGPALEWIA